MADFLFDVLEQIPEELHNEAKKREDGKYVLNLVPKVKIDEFRENNVELAKAKEALAKRVEKYAKVIGEDETKFLEELTELRKMRQRVADGDLSESNKIEEVLSERTKKMREAHEDELRRLAGEGSTWKNQYETVTEQLKGVQIDNYIRSAIHDPKSGARGEAEPHILLEARKVFKIDGDKIIPKNGDSTIYGSDGATPMSPVEWMKTLQKQMPYLFKDSNGGGANGSGMSSYGMTREELNKLSPMERLMLANKNAK